MYLGRVLDTVRACVFILSQSLSSIRVDSPTNDRGIDEDGAEIESD